MAAVHSWVRTSKQLPMVVHTDLRCILKVELIELDDGLTAGSEGRKETKDPSLVWGWSNWLNGSAIC